MRYFKLPLIVTGVAFGLMIVIGIVGMVIIDRTGVSDKEKSARAGLLGSGLGTMTCLIIAPFWIFAGAKFGKDRRAAMEEQKTPKKNLKRKKDKE